jgi:hypothetical protein
MKKIICLLCFALVFSAAFAEDSTLVPEHQVRVTLAPAFGFQVEEWEWLGAPGDNSVTLFNLGAGVEFSPVSWVGAQILWTPGANVWSDIEGGDYGAFSDVYVGIKTVILAGENAIVNREKFEKIRLAAALGIVIPTPRVKDSIREPAQHLYGSSVQVFFDYIFHPIFTANAFLEAIYYPWQYADTPQFTQGAVNHPVDMNIELEGRFQYPLPNAGLVLRWGVPFRFFVAPVYNDLDSYAPGEQYRFTVGAWFGVTFTNAPIPIDVFVKYSAPVAGKNDQGVHTVSLVGRFAIDITKKWSRPKPAKAEIVETEETEETDAEEIVLEEI